MLCAEAGEHAEGTLRLFHSLLAQPLKPSNLPAVDCLILTQITLYLTQKPMLFQVPHN